MLDSNDVHKRFKGKEYLCVQRTQRFSSCGRNKSTSLRAYQTVVYTPLRQEFTTLKSYCGSSNFLLLLNACEVNNIITTMQNFTRCKAMRNVHMHVLYSISLNSVLPGDAGLRRWARINIFAWRPCIVFAGFLCVPPPLRCQWNGLIEMNEKAVFFNTVLLLV